MSRFLAGLFLALLLLSPVAAEPRPFGEFWNSVSYYDTNLERKGFASLLSYFGGKLGLELGPLQFYGTYYATIASDSPNYWDNAICAGPGLSFCPLVDYQAKGWVDEWIPNLRVFYESLHSSFLKNAASGEANLRDDTRYGFDLWHEWNLDKPDLNNFWGEVWANYSYRTTNFNWTDFKGTILYFQPKIGWHLGQGIEPYIKADLTTSSQDSYWLNVADYGFGIRFEPWRRDYPSGDSILKNFKMFAEILSVSYLKDRPTNPNSSVERDVRFGVDFSFGR